jgi:hypothetical protein
LQEFQFADDSIWIWSPRALYGKWQKEHFTRVENSWFVLYSDVYGEVAKITSKDQSHNPLLQIKSWDFSNDR